jgi:hypothetical protein
MDLDRLNRLGRATDGGRDRNRYRKIVEKYVQVGNQPATLSAGCAVSDISDISLTREETFSSPLDFNEVRGLPARLLSELPLPPVLVIEVAGFDTSIILDFRPRPNTWRRQPEPRYASFELDEIIALVEACENGRCRPKDFVAWCQRKAKSYWRLDRVTALNGADGLIARPPKPKGWTVGEFLKALGCQLRLIKLESAKTADRGPYSEAKQ